MSSLKEFIRLSEEECRKDKSALIHEIQASNHSKHASHHLQSSKEAASKAVGTLASQQRMLDVMLKGISSLSKEIIVSMNKLKQKKHNANQLLNEVTSMQEVKRLIKTIDNFDQNSNIDGVKKFTLQLHYALENVPAKYFSKEQEEYAKYRNRMEKLLKERLETSLREKKVGEVNSITTIMNILKIKYNVVEKYEHILSSKVQEQMQQVLAGLEKKVKTFVSIRSCLHSESYDVKADFEDASVYPEIFFAAVVDALTIKFDNLSALNDSSFVLDTPATFKKFLALLLDESLSRFFRQVKVRMDKFFGFDFMGFVSRKEEIAILIEKEARSGAKLEKTSEETVVLEYYLTEVMNVANQFHLFADEVVAQIEVLVKPNQPESKFDASLWKHADVKRLVQSFAFNADVMEMLASFKVVQEKLIKNRMAIICSTSASLRALFYGDPKTLNKLVSAGVEEGKSESSNSKDGAASAYDFIDDLFYCLKTSLLRAIKTMDKITACSLITYTASTTICSDLFKLVKQLLLRFLRLAEDDATAVGFVAGENNHNRGAIVAINSVKLVIDYTGKLAAQLEEMAKRQFESPHDAADLNLITESCRGMELQTQKSFKELLRTSVASFLESMLKSSIQSTLANYQSYDLLTSEKTMQDYDTFPAKWSVALKVCKRLEGCLPVWKDGLLEEVQADFFKELASGVANQVLGIIRKKKFNQLGALLIEKEASTLLQFLESQTDQPLSKPFAKLTASVEVLLADSKSEARLAGAKVLDAKEVESLIAQRIDLI